MKRSVGPKLTQMEIETAQQRLPFLLPKQVVDFYLKTNGGVPVNDGWDEDQTGEYWIKQFLPLGDPSNENSVESAYARGVSKDYLDGSLIPFAIDHGGNYFCFDQMGGVHFYALDGWSSNASLEENKSKADMPLTTSFDAFIDHLQPYEG